MTDFDYDVMQKKRIASGAYHRKGTTNRKGCVLPHELLKPKELKKLNGKITTVSLMRPITWERLKGLASDLQEEYLNTQIRRFGVGLATIGRELFGISDAALGNYVRDHELAVISAPPGRQPKAARESWQRWLRSETITAPSSETANAPQVTMCEEDFKTPTTEHTTEPEVKPFRAHDFEDMFKEMGMEREMTPTLPKEEDDSENVNFYPLTDLNLTLIGTPIDILATLRMSFPALLDKDKTYRFQIKADTFTKRWTTEDA